jgi:hypothetical protein
MAPRFGSNEVGGMFDNLKSRLGFGDDDSARAGRVGRNDGYDDEFDEGEDYGNGSYDEEFSEYGADYDEGNFDFGDTDDQRSSRRGGSSFSTTSSARGAYRNSNLVTIEDVKAHTSSAGSANRDAHPQYHGIGARTVVDDRHPAPQTPVAKMAAANGVSSTGSEQLRSSGLNSLFNPTTEDAPSADDSAHEPASSAPDAWSRNSYDPYDAYESASPSRHTPARGLKVLKPASYGEAEKICKTLKAGDVVILSLRNTPDNLSKRILDFSFGAASALDASVDSLGDKVFAIMRGEALSAAEKTALKNQGVL